ncbi:hypothetical protein QWY84_19095 [Aquisalimonas lutea]|uniref:hypothetical protein n=1 Tax=Aquisalimonas lutea TaxID=1327750 RepID=UPI0025B3A137|nr:hypothetical protein [Aquisalimonas lutea]MDN3519720.1 hypothetical protein [Aquisalimonas lutea]
MLLDLNREQYEASLEEGPPALGTPRLEAWQEQFQADFERFGRSQEALYSSADVGVCELTREQAYRAALGVTLEERTAEMRRANERHKAFEVTFYEPTFRAVVLEGTCGPDGLEGEAVASMRLPEIYQWSGSGGSHAELSDTAYRVRGTFEAGEPVGEHAALAVSTNAKGTFAGGTFRAGTYDGLWLQAMKTEPAAAYYYSDYSASGEVEQQVIFRRHPTNGAATTRVNTRTSPRSRNVRMYQGANLLKEFSELDDAFHGWATTYNTADGSVWFRHCYQDGEHIEEAASCPGPYLAILAEQGGEISEDERARTRGLVIEGTGGRYMSPFTRDDTVAEWVNQAQNVSMGATAGSAVGAAAGVAGAGAVMSELGEGMGGAGGLLFAAAGAIIGSAAGEEAGRQTALDAIGGEAFLRETSDRSFASLDHMARYLIAHYHDNPNLEAVMRATVDVYPEFAAAVARVQ